MGKKEQLPEVHFDKEHAVLKLAVSHVKLSNDIDCFSVEIQKSLAHKVIAIALVS